MGGNLGWKFYKGLYRNLNPNGLSIDFHILNEIERTNFTRTDSFSEDFVAPYGFKVKIGYPGLLIGLGYSHGIPDVNDDIKNGFYFDFTSGYPAIPGSSVKGVIRSMFPNYEKDEKGKFKDKYLKEKEEFINDMIFTLFHIKNLNLKELVDEIFEGINPFSTSEKDKYLPIYKRDKFLDAYIVNAPNGLISLDYITPHKEFEDPVPIRIIKIKPDVEISFNFILYDGILKAEQKEKLFFELLKCSGIGAKTNSGYGNFVNDEMIDSHRQREIRRKEINEKRLKKLEEQKQKERLKTLPPEERIFEKYKNNIPELINNIEKVSEENNLDIKKLALLIKKELQKTPATWDKAKKKKLERKKLIQRILGEL
jgi:CRISPR-associated protein Cmr6